MSPYEFDLNQARSSEGNAFTEYNVQITTSGLYRVMLPITNFQVDYRLLRGQDEIDMVKAIQNKKSKEDRIISNQLKKIIVSINDYNERHIVEGVIEKLPAQDSIFLRNVYKASAPDIKIVEDFACPSCGFEQELEVPFGADFFGLTDEYMENVYEQFFILKHYGSWSLIELYNLPVGLRKWWLERTVQEYEKQNEEQKKAMNKGRR